MTSNGPLLPQQKRVPLVTAASEGPDAAQGPVATRDPELIRRWAADRQATPATGEASASGPLTVDVRDGGAGIRFNFPALSRFRDITWEEWFENFRQHDLTLVFEEHTADGTRSNRYRLIRLQDWDGQFDTIRC
jgi:hypothetical protein